MYLEFHVSSFWLNKKVTQKVVPVFHRFAQKSPVNGFYQIWNVPLMEIINADKLCINLFKGFDFTVGQNFHFPIGNWRRRYKCCATAQPVISVTGSSWNFQPTSRLKTGQSGSKPDIWQLRTYKCVARFVLVTLQRTASVHFEKLSMQKVTNDWSCFWAHCNKMPFAIIVWCRSFLFEL